MQFIKYHSWGTLKKGMKPSDINGPSPASWEGTHLGHSPAFWSEHRMVTIRVPDPRNRYFYAVLSLTSSFKCLPECKILSGICLSLKLFFHPKLSQEVP